jgi:2-(1,2-epoxy-1,2-dihydrophenyl)acetyl-CoA isomerase
MNNSDILYVKEGPIAKITLNRPNKMNSYTVEMNDIFKRSVMNASKDKNIRVIIITGTGRAFCSGADVKTLSERFDQPDTDDMLRHVLRSRTSVVSLLRKCNKPVIAAVNGVAVGGGFDLALACDIRIASDRARFSEIYVRRGLVPTSGGTYLLPRLIGIDKALMMLWTGNMVDAKEAERLGLVTMVVPYEELETTVFELAEKLAKGPPLVIQWDKRAVYDGLQMDLDETMEYTKAITKIIMYTKDHREGAKAFVEKREPVFKGE